MMGECESQKGRGLLTGLRGGKELVEGGNGGTTWIVGRRYPDQDAGQNKVGGESAQNH